MLTEYYVHTFNDTDLKKVGSYGAFVIMNQIYVNGMLCAYIQWHRFDEIW